MPRRVGFQGARNLYLTLERAHGYICGAIACQAFRRCAGEGLKPPGHAAILKRNFDRGEGITLQTAVQKRSYRTERDFGLLVGGVFVALGGWWFYRGRYSTLSIVLLVVGATLMLLGAFLPRALVVPNRLWMGLAEAMGYVSTRVILGVVFFLFVTPIGLVRRLFGGDPLGRRALRTESYWKPYTERRLDPKHYEKMY